MNRNEVVKLPNYIGTNKIYLTLRFIYTCIWLVPANLYRFLYVHIYKYVCSH